MSGAVSIATSRDCARHSALDNVTHTFAGLLIAEGVLAAAERLTGRETTPRVRRATLLASAVSNNLPDADFVYSWITPGNLGYLLHHRGHTHTLVVAFALGLVVLGASIAWLARRGGIDVAARRMLIAVSLLGPLAHIAMDAWNSYGVHPFWPFDDRWYYGDSVFILEPLLWVTAIPSFFVWARTKTFRGILALLLAFIVVLPWLLPEYVPISLRLTLIGLTIAASLVAWRGSPGARFVFPVVGWLTIVLGLASTSLDVRESMEARLSAELPDEHIHDLVLSPFPASPWCWMMFAITTDANDESLIIRRATVAAAPDTFDAWSCPTPPERTTAGLAPPARPSDAQVRWIGEVRAPLARFRALAARCDVAALLRFARVPFFVDRDGATIVGDLRFDRREELDFAEIEIPAELDCPRFVPPWVPPRSDVLYPR